MKGNKIQILGDIACILLNNNYVAVIDAADVPLVNQYTWTAVESKRTDGALRTVYVSTSVRKDGGTPTTLQMHRLLLDAPVDKVTDHIDGNGLHNRRSNLRLVTPRLNAYNMGIASHNTSGFKGVHWNRMTHKFHAVITVDKKPWIVGKFKTPEEAAHRYDHAARRFYGKYACLNFPEEGEQSAHRNTA